MRKIFSRNISPALMWPGMLAWLIMLGVLQTISASVFANVVRPSVRPILFIQEGIEDRQLLIDGAGPEVEVVLLDGRSNGLRQIAELLHERHGVQSLHVISHGAPGQLALGSSEVDTTSLEQQKEELATIRRALDSNADILLYGCQVASGMRGSTFLTALANATGAHVAASTDLTGAAGLGGNWTLESRTGQIHSATLTFPAYPRLLPSMAGTVSYLVAGARTVDPLFHNYGANNKSNSGAPGGRYSMYFGNSNGSVRNSGDTMLGYGTPLTLRSIDSVLNVLVQQAFIIKNDDGLPFRMNSFLVLDNTHTNNPTLTATAYYNGLVKGTQTFTVPQGGTYSGTIVLNSVFNDITELRIDGGAGAQLRQWFNDFNFADPILSTDSFLDGLLPSQGSLNQSFASDWYDYTISVPNLPGTISFTPTVTDVGRSTVKVNGVLVTSGTASAPIALVVGANSITTEVTSHAGGAPRVYTTIVTRAVSANADLSALSTSAGTLSPGFAATTLAYTALVPYTSSTLSVTPTLADGMASVKVNGVATATASASAPIALAVGINHLSVLVTAPDGTTQKTYAIDVTRSGNADLGNLTASSGLDQAFATATLGYTATVANATTSLTVTPSTSYATSTVKVNSATVASGTASAALPLAVGSNLINVVVTAQDGSTSTYTVTVTRQASGDASLSALATSAGSLSPVFGSATLAYSMTLPNAQATLSVTPTVADSTATVKVNGTTVASGAASSALPMAVGANVITVLVTAQNGSTVSYTLNVTRQASSNASLSALSASAGTLSPVFSSATLAYNMTLPNAQTTLVVTPTVADSTATVKVNGSLVTSGTASSALPLVVGANLINVVVTAQDGTTANYALTVTRQASANASLSALSASAGTLGPVFGSATLAYSMTLPNAQTTLVVTPTVADSTATVKVNGTVVASGAASTALPLAVGANIINVVVTAQDGSSATYALTVTRQGSANANLSALNPSTGTLSPVFGPATLAYSMTLPNAQATLTVTPTLADSTASVKVNGTAVASGAASTALSLAVGSNLINVVVTAQDGSTATYVVTVTRQPSANANLSALSASAGTLSPVFGPAILIYSIALPNAQATLAVTPTVADSNASVKVNGTAVVSGAASSALPLVVGGNVITILVTAQDGSTASYTLNVTRQPSGNAGLGGLGVSTGTLSPVFGSTTFAYSMTLPNAQATLAVTPTVADSTATVKVNGGAVISGAASTALPLVVGANIINVVVTAQDGSSAAYALTVTRQGSANASLSALSTSTGTLSPVFGSATLAYSMTLPNAQATLAVTPTVADSTASVKVNGTAVASGIASTALPLAVGSNLINIVVTAQDGSTATYALTVTRQASANASLSALGASTGTLSPVFGSSTLTYSMTLPNAQATLNVTPTVADSTATVKVNGITVVSGTASSALPLVVGANVIMIVVTAQNSATSTYTLNVTRQASANAGLNGLGTSVGTLSPVFSSATFAYSMALPNAQATLTVTPTVADSTATVKVNGIAVATGAASTALPLVVGANVINVVVTAQDGTTATYVLSATRQPSSNASLSALSASAGTLNPVFSPATLVYSMTLPNAQATLAVTPTVSDSTAYVKVNGTAVASGTASTALPLAVGANIINLVVTAQDGSTATYALTVTRQGSSNASLSALSTSAGTLSPVFGSATLVYAMTLPNAQTTLTVTPTVADSTASAKINGTAVASGAASTALPLAVGANIINIVVTAQDGVTATYALTVTRQASANANLSALNVSAGALGPVFGSATLAYNISLPNSSASLTLTPALADSTAAIKINGVTAASGSAAAPVALNVGGNVINVVVTAQDGTVLTYVLNVMRLGSSNANLASLLPSAGSLSPAFAAATSSYTMTLPEPSASIGMTAGVADVNATLSIKQGAAAATALASGAASTAMPLAYGANTIVVTVTAQDGTSKPYTIVVNRSAPSNNANLATLTLSSGNLSPAFAAVTTSYIDDVHESISAISITANPADAGATLTVNGAATNSGVASAAVALHYGANAITVVVTAADGSSKPYAVTVNRASPSSNAYLSNLGLSSGTLDSAFITTTNSYSTTVTNTVTAMVLTPTLADSTATVKVNGNLSASGAAAAAVPLAVGPNAIAIDVTAQDGVTVQHYVLNVTRAAPPPPAPIVNAAAATAVTAAGATLNGSVNANGGDASVSFLYGTTAAYGTSVAVAMAPAAAGNLARSTALSGLRCNTVYHYTLQATNTSGNSRGNDEYFTTAACTVAAPGVPAAPGTPVAAADSEQVSVTFAAAETNGSAITGYLLVSSPAGGVDSQAGSTALTHLVTGLKNGVAYTFTVVASNAVGAGPVSLPSNSVTPVGAALSGMVYRDDNDNGLNDPGESGIAGVAVALDGVDSEGRTVHLTTVTAVDGGYAFGNLKGGTYTLTETQPAAYLDGRERAGDRGGNVNNSAFDASEGNNRIGPILLERGQSGSGYLFGERAVGSLSGQVYVDANDNGMREAGEAGLAGVRIVLSGQTADGTDVCALFACTAITGADGGYRFAGLPPGLYTLARNPADTDGARYADGRETAGVAGGVVNNDNFGTLPYQTRITSIGVTAALQARVSGHLDGYLFGLRARTVSDLKLPVLSGSVTLRHKSALDDGAVAGWSVALMQNEKLVCTVLSNAQGQYRFDNLVCPEYRQSGLPTGSGFSISFSKAGSNVKAMPSSGGAAGTAARGVIRDLVLSGWDDIGQQDLPLDPEGIIYDAVSRLPLAGAVITLAGPPGFDAGRHLVGGAVVQTQTTGSDGMYQYLLQNGYPSGVYTLKVTQAPGGYKTVSSLLPPCSGILTIGPVPDPAYLQSNDGSPPASTPLHDARACPGLVEGGAVSTQYYLQLLITNGVSAPILNNHIPLDAPAPGNLALSKSGDRQRAELGDSVRYSLVLKRTLGGAPRRIAVRDELPSGFRFIPGTVTVNGVKAVDPSGSGSVLGFNLGVLGGDQQMVLAYRVRVGVGSMQGDGVNRARAYACGDGGTCLDAGTLAPMRGALASNQASFKIQVDAGVFSNEACVVGKVFADCDGDGIQGPNEHGIPAVRLYLEDGTHITTDEDGKYSYCGLTPKTHVIKLDPSTLPDGSVAGITGNRNLGDPGSVLLDLSNGELRRADFTEISCTAPVLKQIRSRRTQGASAAPQASPGITFSSKPAEAGGRAAGSVKAKSNEQ